MYKSLSEIKTNLDKISSHKSAAESAFTQMQHDIGKIDSRFSAEVIREKTAEIREKHAGTIRDNFSQIRELSDSMAGARQFWSNKSFILSTRPASETVNGHAATAAKDAGIEATTRLQMMTEFQRMPTELLRLRVLAEKSAAMAGSPAGGLYLASMEYATRSQAPDYEAISLDDVVLEDQRQALQMLDAVKAAETSTEHLFRQSLGQTITATDRITAARELAAGGSQ